MFYPLFIVFVFTVVITPVYPEDAPTCKDYATPVFCHAWKKANRCASDTDVNTKLSLVFCPQTCELCDVLWCFDFYPPEVCKSHQDQGWCIEPEKGENSKTFCRGTCNLCPSSA